jgi:aldehyde:ferredoxin oxidoreductase
MPYAYAGRILHVDLTKRKYMIEPLNFVYARKYIGGKGLAARYFF